MFSLNVFELLYQIGVGYTITEILFKSYNIKVENEQKRRENNHILFHCHIECENNGGARIGSGCNNQELHLDSI